MGHNFLNKQNVNLKNVTLIRNAINVINVLECSNLIMQFYQSLLISFDEQCQLKPMISTRMVPCCFQNNHLKTDNSFHKVSASGEIHLSIICAFFDWTKDTILSSYSKISAVRVLCLSVNVAISNVYFCFLGYHQITFLDYQSYFSTVQSFYRDANHYNFWHIY